MAKEKAKLMAGVEIHPPRGKIDHPVVMLEWCVSREITNLMRKYSAYKWAMMIVAQERLELNSEGLFGFAREAREERVLVEGIRRIADGRTPFTFRAPVNYDVAVFLVRSNGTSDEDARTFWKHLRGLSKRTNYSCYAGMADVVSEDLPNPDVFGNSLYIVPVAADNIVVSVPDGIFAKPSPKRQALVRAYGFRVGDDECDLRGRLFLCALFSPLFLALQLLWRGHWVIAALTHFLVGGNPTRLLADVFSVKEYWPSAGFFGRFRFAPMGYVHGKSGKWYRASGFVLFVLGYVWALFFGNNVYFLDSTLQMFAIVAPVVIAAIVILSVVLRFAGNLGAALVDKYFENLQPARVEQEILRVEEYALCGVERQEGPRTFHLMYSGIKSMVCRPNAK